MKKTYLVLPILALLAVSVYTATAADPHPSGKPVQGTFKADNPQTVADGEDYFFELDGGPVGAQARLWVDTGENKGFRDFGILGTTQQSSTAYASSGKLTVHKTLKCNAYEYLEPGKTLSVGNRDLYQKFYIEYVGKNLVSPVSWSIRDCSQTGEPVATNNPIFPYTLESVYGRNHIIKAFPDSYPSGMPASLKFAGRYFDGKDRGGINMGLKFEWFTIFGGKDGNPVKVTNSKVYSLLGSTIAAYKKDTFISRLANKTNNTLAVFAGSQESSGETLKDKFDHAILPWDGYIYPEHGDNAWLREACDCHTGLQWFEVDDRGYIYFNDRFGFGIARDEGTNVRVILQVRGVGGLSIDDKPITLPWLRSAKNGTIKIIDMDGWMAPHSDGDKLTVVKTGSGSGAKYYVAITGPRSGGSGGTRVIDVTSPNDPKYVRSSPEESIAHLAQIGSTVLANTGSEIRIYNASTFIDGGEPKKTFSAGEPITVGTAKLAPVYAGLAVDKSSGRFYSIHYSSTPRPGSSIPYYPLPTASISVFSPSSGSYIEKKNVVDLGGKGTTSGWGGYQYIFSAETLSYQSGYLSAEGRSPDGYDEIRMWKITSGAPQVYDIGTFFRDYYQSSGQILQASLHLIGGKLYLFVNSYYMGDVYEVTGLTGTTPLPPPDNGVPCSLGSIYNFLTGERCDGGGYIPPFGGGGRTSPAPVIGDVVGPTTLNVNQQGVWAVTATDPANDDIVWSVDWGYGRSLEICKVNPPVGSGINSSYSIAHAWPTAGNYTVKVYAIDCKGGTGTKTFTVSVK